jgi:serpin B
MEIANSMLIQQDYTIKPEYIDIVKKNYNIPIEKVNFKSKQDRIEITKEVNNWVKSNTNNQIQQLLESSDLSKYTRLLLINAIYFHGEWKYEFDEKRTRKQVFKSPKAERSVNFMSKDADFLYYSDSILSSVQIPYKGDDISMTILLPKEDINIDKLDNRLNINYLDNIVSQMNKKKVFLDIPKFTIEYSINLKQTFQAMGMVDAFSKIADFSNITEKNDLKIDKILHKSKINIDEKGTKASSATSVSMIQKTAFIPSIKFKANRPFVYVIRENHTGIILFVGKVCDFEL